MPTHSTDEATEELLDLLDYIGARNRAAAERLNGMIRHTADQLPAHRAHALRRTLAASPISGTIGEQPEVYAMLLSTARW